MKSFSLFSFVVVAILAGCSSSADSGSSSSVDGTSPTGTTPDGFCAKKCIPEDQDECLAFANRFSDAFLAAFEVCGDNPKCIEPKLDSAPKTERQEKLGVDYCATCGCKADFFSKDEPGGSLRTLSDARLDEVEAKCFPELEPGITCALSFQTCVLPILQEDLKAGVICRARR